MMNWVSFPTDSEGGRQYAQLAHAMFPRLRVCEFRPGLHIALKSSEGRIIGGATLQPFHSLHADSELTKLWQIRRSPPAVRIVRLWSESQMAVPSLIGAILQSVAPDDFLYGLLSIPFSHVDHGSSDKDWLRPIFPLPDCDWAKDSQATSEGTRLLKMYRRLGAEFLGDASADESSGSIKVAMGIRADEAQPFSLQRRQHASAAP